MSKIVAFCCFGVGFVCIGIGGYQVTEPWRRPQIERVRFDFQLPAAIIPRAVYTVPLTIENKNRSAITIYGEYTC